MEFDPTKPGSPYPDKNEHFGIIASYPHQQRAPEFFAEKNQAEERSKYLAEAENKGFVIVQIIGRTTLSKVINVEEEKS